MQPTITLSYSLHTFIAPLFPSSIPSIFIPLSLINISCKTLAGYYLLEHSKLSSDYINEGNDHPNPWQSVDRPNLIESS